MEKYIREADFEGFILEKLLLAVRLLWQALCGKLMVLGLFILTWQVWLWYLCFQFFSSSQCCLWILLIPLKVSSVVASDKMQGFLFSHAGENQQLIRSTWTFLRAPSCSLNWMFFCLSVWSETPVCCSCHLFCFLFSFYVPACPLHLLTLLLTHTSCCYTPKVVAFVTAHGLHNILSRTVCKGETVNLFFMDVVFLLAFLTPDPFFKSHNLSHNRCW